MIKLELLVGEECKEEGYTVEEDVAPVGEDEEDNVVVDVPSVTVSVSKGCV